MGSYNDYWTRARDFDGKGQECLADRLLEEMLATTYESLSNRDYIEFFTIISQIHDWYPDVVRRHAKRLVAKMLEDHRINYRQDQVNKAQLLYELGPLINPEQLISFVQDGRQDLDTRNAAVKLLWNKQSIETSGAVNAVKAFSEIYRTDIYKGIEI